MKVSIPLNSSLCTDSHPNDIKDPSKTRNLFNKNQSYFYNNHLTNAKKQIEDSDGYITTNGDILKVIPGSTKTQIYHKGQVIADILSLGIEDTLFLNVDDAVIHDGFLWTVKKQLSGYTLEQTNLQTGEIVILQFDQADIEDIRFIRNTHKLIIRLSDSSLIIDGVPESSQDIREYLASFNGEFVAVEVNNEIYFGYNNPAGVEIDPPETVLNINIPYQSTPILGWSLRAEMDKLGADQNKGYVINITVADNVQIGASSNNIAMDMTDIVNPQLQFVNLILGANIIISGRGGDGGYGTGKGQDGTTAIKSKCNLTITGSTSSTIQGGGGGGGTGIPSGGAIYHTGGGGAGIPAGLGGYLGYAPGTATQGGITAANTAGGNGGDPGKNGSPGKGASNNTAGGNAGKAIEIFLPAICTVDSVTIKGEIKPV